MKEWGHDPDAALKTSLVVASCLAHIVIETNVHEVVFKALGRVLGATQRRVRLLVRSTKTPGRQPQGSEVADLL
jgi:hypothetical protein